MDIFESLENLQVSEACFNDIVGLVEEYLSEGENLKQVVNRAKKAGKISPSDAYRLGTKAKRIPSINDIHVRPDGTLDLSNLSGKTVKKESGEGPRARMKRIEKGRDVDELNKKRENDEARGFPQAIAKSIRRKNK